ncbi:BRCA1-A complex subunit RAP80-like [Bufo gargarizans]|uniref:BRCA1-A complex subunit RAP80-like n=1 Tax=Bufo gargarizans TaxID=30331 RepID=UPI001CF451C7|nr:BRCA1-A complex subunit RAP80-like [Bufo gargarizans]
MSAGRASEVLMSMHHRRKQRLSEGTYRQYMIDSEEPISEPTTSDGPKSRTDNKDSSVVISDSDDAELQEESILPKKRRRPPPHRKPLPVKRKLAQMTEEEQLALAVQMSQQEQAKPEGYTQEEEDELIKKAIEESLHSCQVPDILVSATKDELTSGASSSHEYCEKEPHSSKESKPSGEISAKSPVVRLQRLSQDIVESSSVILSPNCKDPISCIENCLQSALSPCTSSNFVKASPAKELALSPVFPKKSPRPCKLIPCRLFQEISPSVDRPVDDLDDQCTHCSESPQIDSLSMLPTSCSQGESLYQNDCGKTETFHTDKAKKLDCEKGIESSDCRAGKTNQSGGTVHYYWGVPFCPKGVDPSEYTKVILCQLEVYQKSLKSAQRQLLHKMDYGQPIHLTASSRKYFKEDTQGSVSQEDTEECVAEDDTQKPDEDETERDDNSDSQETQYLSSKRQKISQSLAQTGLENDHCSSSQDENDSVKELQEESILPKKRRRPPPHRKPLPVKRKLARKNLLMFKM